ncbi:tyrosine-type recombinase/integrase [Sphingomonas faeni]|uniref:tyrosine-type recombinase/integrase n=1 Tax=Sphingomonas faeni TaxID=185950 RepID=UPI0020C81D4D|nr:integrase arm-type DNA-binding domain-containing protein [Sphingomonas faeni]MCP8893216.1 integrase arm-type DNA-binding domain-containing protein [Sphingomonas faeni]
MALTDLQVRKAQPREKAYKLADSGGLYLFVAPSGARSWRMKYRYADKEKVLTFGPYPLVSLAAARDQRDAAKLLLRDHRDPSIEKRKRKMAAYAAAGATFEITAKRWHADQTPRWSPLQATKVRQAFERDVYPVIGFLPLIEIDAPMVLKMLRKVEGRGAIDTAKRIRQHVSAVFGYAIAEGICTVDPAASIGKALKPIAKKGKQPAVRTIDAAREVLLLMEDTTSGPLTKLASRLLALTVVRPGVVRAAKWTEFEEIDWDDPAAITPNAVWRVPAERMKLNMENKDDEAFEHVIPLPQQAVEILHAVRRLTGRSAYLFTSVRSSRHPMSENTIGYMYARNGYSGRHVPHGWRATFSTIMNERAIRERRPDDRAIIDAMLAHKPKGMSGSEMAYNRALHMDRRRELAQDWADMLIVGLRSADALLSGQER